MVSEQRNILLLLLEIYNVITLCRQARRLCRQRLASRIPPSFLEIL